MTAALLHDLLAAAACYGLWRLWRRWFGGGDVRVAWLAGAGFFLRALLGQALFWISYLHLQLGRSLQLGDGLWFFAADGRTYMDYARNLAQRGPSSIVLLDGWYPSRSYVQALAAFVMTFGEATSVALLLNCAAYLATCALVVRLQPRVNGAVLFALGAIAFGPGTLIWSLQPLKDTLFALLIAALVFVCARWQARWSVGLAAAIVVLTYGLASIRWYFGVIVWVLLAPFFVASAWRAPRRGWMLLGSAALFVVLSQAVRIGGNGDVHPTVRRMLDPRSATAALQRPAQVTQVLTRARRGFDRTPGGTTIAPGPVLATPAPASRMIGGLAAAFLPRVAGQSLGLIRVGGGRGLWIFAEADTLAFDAVLLFALVYSVRARRRITPLFVFVLLVLVATAGPMIYTVNNFGTLFRLREMLYVLAAILPVTLAPDPRP